MRFGIDLPANIDEIEGHLDGRLSGHDFSSPEVGAEFGEGQRAVRSGYHHEAPFDPRGASAALDLGKVVVGHSGTIREGNALRRSKGREVLMKFHSDGLSHRAKQNANSFADERAAFAFGGTSQNANGPATVQLMDRHEIRRVNLLAVCKMMGGKAKLAEALGVQPPRISQWLMEPSDDPEREKNKRYISDTSCRQLETLPALRVHGVGEGWMDRPHDADVVPSNGGSTYPARMVRVITWAQAGEARDMETAVSIVDWDDSDTGEWISVYSPAAGSRTFALRVRDDSMVNPTGDRSYPVGSLIVVDPDKSAKSGDRVVVRLAHAPEAIFKQFVFDGQHRWLVPLNTRYAPEKMPVDAEIVGVVIQMTREE